MATIPKKAEQDNGTEIKTSQLVPHSSEHDASNVSATAGLPAVRFASKAEEIAPVPSAASETAGEGPVMTEENAQQIKELSKSLQGRPLQQRRMNTSHFETFSLPPSRVPSREDELSDASRVPTPNSPSLRDSPLDSPRVSALVSPPLTPSGTDSLAASDERARLGSLKTAHDPSLITPQPTSSNEKHTSTSQHDLPYRAASGDSVSQRPPSAGDAQNDSLRSHRRGMFGSGPRSAPASREASPSRSSASNFYSKPMTPGADVNDPYSKGRRPPQQQNANRASLDARFVFSRKKNTGGSPNASRTNLSEKRSSGIFGAGKPDDLAPGGGGTANVGHQHHGNHSQAGSMVDLRRFFRKSGHAKKRDESPAPSKAGTVAAQASKPATQQLPFGDDHGLSTKYGKLGKVLGSGAGGSVRLMKRREDGTVFAVKEFRARHTYESEREYNKKVTAEFCVGSTLHHGNIIETLDILQERGRWYEVMEYAPFDLFAIVMTGRMTRAEVTCCFLQILNGVTYLHSMGLAHRDMKLDNVVVSDRGIMKIIDFGSAHVFRYPFESGVAAAKGIVGSDPYLAPEVYDVKEYDAAAVDIWSLAIIYCCMSLRRFPWKLPRLSDNSYKLFAADPTPGHNPETMLAGSDIETTDGESQRTHRSHHSHSHSQAPAESNTGSQAQIQSGEKKEVIRGPWRILRLLPRESRRIIFRMLDVNPKTRATMEDILAEHWIADSIICQQWDDGEVVPAGDHTHVLEPPASQPPPPPRK